MLYPFNHGDDMAASYALYQQLTGVLRVMGAWCGVVWCGVVWCGVAYVLNLPVFTIMPVACTLCTFALQRRKRDQHGRPGLEKLQSSQHSSSGFCQRILATQVCLFHRKQTNKNRHFY